jgi:hypothetical protein
VRGHAKVLTLRQGWRRIALMLALNFCFIVIVTLPIDAALYHWAGLEESVKTDATKISQWVISVLIAPLGEELAFRAGLRQVKYSLFVAPVLIAMLNADKMLSLIMAGILLSIAAADAIRLRYAPLLSVFVLHVAAHLSDVIPMFSGCTPSVLAWFTSPIFILQMVVIIG